MVRRKKSYSTRRRMTSAQAAALLLLFCLPAAGLAMILWNGVHSAMEYYARFKAYDVIILKAGERNGVDPALLKAVIWQESKFAASTIGSKGEIGLMQIMPKFAVADWAKYYSRRPPSKGALADPELNIEIGSWYLGRALRRWKSYTDCETLALCEYNAGYQRASAWKPQKLNDPVADRIDIRSTQNYVRNILKKRKEYTQELRKNKRK